MNIRALTLVLFCAMMLSLGLPSSATPERASPARFEAASAGQNHCPHDEVFWLNIPTAIYQKKGMRWYGRLKNGAFVCHKEADAAGDRDTRNGQ